MATAVVFAFAVADGVLPVVGAAPPDVLARQMPRLLVERLNGGGDRGARFFPFLGPVDGERAFLRPRELFAPDVLVRLHQQGEVALLVDAEIRQQVLRWRLLDGPTGRIVIEQESPFDPLRPLDALLRIEFEIMGELGWTGRPEAMPALCGEPLGWFLVLKDELLRRDARVAADDRDPLRSARRCVALAATAPDVQAAVMDYAAALLRGGERRDEVAAVIAALAPAVDGPRALGRLGGLALAAGDEGTAVTLAVRAALAEPRRADLVERAAAMAFQLGRDADVRAVVEAARAAGAASPGALAQLAAAFDRAGQHGERQRIVETLVGLGELPAAVARLVVSFLLEDERPEAAREVLERALRREPGHAMLHFEFGRASLLLDDGAAAAEAMRRALALGLAPTFSAQAQRLLRLASVPGLWAGTQRVEHAMAAGDLAAASRAGRDLVRLLARAPEAWLLYGVVCHRLGETRRAERFLRRALRLDDACADAHNRLGVLLLAAGRTDEGHVHLVRAHELAPADVATLLHLAQSCALRGDVEAAARHVDEAERRGAEPRLVEAVRREIEAARA
jgi:tetratricopeptide (TPR) repeat protein